jgi:hypothetical protein
MANIQMESTIRREENEFLNMEVEKISDNAG